MGPVLHYLQWLDKKLMPRLLKILMMLAFFLTIFGIHDTYTSALLWKALHHHSTYAAINDIWLPSMPYILFWLAVIICGFKDWRIILWGFPIISYFLLSLYIEYIIYYYNNMGSFYWDGQFLALFGSISMILGLITLGLHIFIRLKQSVFQNSQPLK